MKSPWHEEYVSSSDLKFLPIEDMWKFQAGTSKQDQNLGDFRRQSFTLWNFGVSKSVHCTKGLTLCKMNITLMITLTPSKIRDFQDFVIFGLKFWSEVSPNFPESSTLRKLQITSLKPTSSLE